MNVVETGPLGKDITIDLDSWNEYKRIGKGRFNSGVLYVLDILIYNEVSNVVVPSVPAPKGYRGIWAVDGAVDLRKKRVYLPYEFITYAKTMGQGSLSVGLRSILLHYQRLSRKGNLKLRPKAPL
jgi:hypothetical protein